MLRATMASLEEKLAGSKLARVHRSAFVRPDRVREVKRVNTSAAFFLSIEFKETGYFVIRAQKSAFGNAKSTPRYLAFLRDQREIGDGVIVGQAGFQQQLETNKQNYLLDFVSRTEFVAQFPQRRPIRSATRRLRLTVRETPRGALPRFAASSNRGRSSTPITIPPLC